MNEIEVINILKRYTDKKERERERESDKILTAFIYCVDLVTFNTFSACSKRYV